MSLNPATKQRIEQLVSSNDVVLFMKGNRGAPQCGFSATVCGILDGLLPDYETHDVLSDPEIRDGIKEFSSWPTIPQLYVRGEFIGGCDIIQEMAAAGELATALGIEAPTLSTPPEIRVTDAAVAGLQEALKTMPAGSVLHLGIDARFENKLFFGPSDDASIAVDAGGIVVHVDPHTAARANGLVLDVVDTPEGQGFPDRQPERSRSRGPADVRPRTQRSNRRRTGGRGLRRSHARRTRAREHSGNAIDEPGRSRSDQSPSERHAVDVSLPPRRPKPGGCRALRGSGFQRDLQRRRWNRGVVARDRSRRAALLIDSTGSSVCRRV